MNKFFLVSGAVLLLLSGCASMNGAEPPIGEAACHKTDEKEIAALFDRWNASLQTNDPKAVAANYAEDAILLPTVSSKPRLTTAERIDYFEHFLQNKPVGAIDMRRIYIGCNTAVDAGLYTFALKARSIDVHARYTYTYRWDGRQWLITSHHSSVLPPLP
ncbi:SgcJ/EcaC family oxidoreductase [Herbaspirillum chlorophenolicum]|uniref:SgcJ/EcaC family oxidoreductase n=1 Tax=Herbaspirillum chlorophenolicum TaxID=211589 RepID=UPI00067C0D3D